VFVGCRQAIFGKLVERVMAGIVDSIYDPNAPTIWIFFEVCSSKREHLLVYSMIDACSHCSLLALMLNHCAVVACDLKT